MVMVFAVVLFMVYFMWFLKYSKIFCLSRNISEAELNFASVILRVHFLTWEDSVIFV